MIDIKIEIFLVVHFILRYDLPDVVVELGRQLGLDKFRELLLFIVCEGRDGRDRLGLRAAGRRVSLAL